jgi:hypothetical protein
MESVFPSGLELEGFSLVAPRYITEGGKMLGEDNLEP